MGIFNIIFSLGIGLCLGYIWGWTIGYRDGVATYKRGLDDIVKKFKERL